LPNTSRLTVGPTMPKPPKAFDVVLSEEPSTTDRQIAELQEKLTAERDGRREDRFVAIVLLAVILDVAFFSVISWGGSLALLVLELVILIPLARRMGMEELGQVISRVLNRVAGKSFDGD
jgi:hypothetical protein